MRIYHSMYRDCQIYQTSVKGVTATTLFLCQVTSLRSVSGIDLSFIHERIDYILDIESK